ncbi:MAG TPA: amidohydrolase family protein [Puia sp.]
MQKIDSHVHFWDYDPVKNSWITEDMAVIRRSFLPQDLEAILKKQGMDGCVLVQVNQAEEENDFFLKLASEHNFVRGMVGWVDLCNGQVMDRLAHYRVSGKIRGFRHILQDETDRAYMLRPDFKRGIGSLREFGFTYDLLIRPDQLPFAAQLVKSFPEQPFIIDHLAKPAIRDQEIADWKKGIYRISRMENAFCKLSGMLTEADWKSWTNETFSPYIDVIVECFGVDRILFGSDWPVCLLAGSYGNVLKIVEEYFSSFTETEKEKIFGGNATAFYGL